MSEEIRKKIEDHARKELYAETNNGRNWMPTRKELQILTRIEAAEFGYQLAQEEFKPSQDELRKEVEELKASLVDERANGRIEWERLQLSEITRLRELLERAKKELMMCATSKTQQLLADIEKLNLKP